MMTPKRFVIVSVFCFSFEVAPCLRSQTAVVIGGRVYDADTNKPLPGVRISTVSVPAGAKTPVVVLSRSHDDGTYTLATPPGKHVLCVDAGKEYLDPCHWSPGTTAVDTTKSSSLDLPLKKGVLLVVQLDDPASAAQAARKLNPALTAVPAPPVAVTITDSSGAARPIPFARSVGTSSEFSVLVPANMAFSLRVASTSLRLADTSGNPLAQNSFQTSLTSPSLSSIVSAPSPLGRHTGPNIPSVRFNFVATGLLSQ